MERLKVSLQTKEIVNPVAQSRNRPSDVIRLTTSNLPEIDWSSSSATPPQPPPLPPMNVDDLLDILSPSSSSRAPPPPANGLQQAVVSVSSSLPDYQPKYTLTSKEGQEKHALFFNTSDARGPAVMPPSSSAGGNASLAIPRYPQPIVDALRMPPPGLLSPEEMQRLGSGPTPGPSLGPQEVEVGQELY